MSIGGASPDTVEVPSRHNLPRRHVSDGPTQDVMLTLPSGVRGGQQIIARTEFGEVVVQLPLRARAGQRLIVRVAV